MAMMHSGNVALMSGSPWDNGNLNAEIHTTVLEKNWTKELLKVAKWISSANQPAEGGTTEPTTLIKDGLQTERSFNLVGNIVGSPTWASCGSLRETIAADLGSLINRGGMVNMTWVDDAGIVEWHEVNFDKVMIRKDAKNTNDLYVQMTLIVGSGF
jgi:hypothetical protein